MRVSGMTFLAILAFSILPACDTAGLDAAIGPSSPSATSINVTASVTTLISGQQAQLTAIVKDQTGNAIPTAAVAWSSATPAIASVSASGLVTAIAPGNASIVAQTSTIRTAINLPIVAADSSVPTTPPVQSAGAAAELPHTYLNTSAATPTGATISVPAGGDLQAALDQAVPGDVIVLQAGASYRGNFTLPKKSGASNDPSSSSVITIRTSSIGSLAAGRRVSPADAPAMARIVATANGVEPIGTAAGTVGWRLIGLEITADPSVTSLGRLVRFGDGSSTQNTPESVPSNLVLDRSYVHGTPALDIRRCIDLQSATSAVIDSYISECHSVGFDAQAIANWNGPGPYKIVNNYLEGSGENIMFGGAPSFVPGQVAADIEIRHNLISKPLTWKKDDPTYAGTPWSVKNLFEIKLARRVLLEGNILEHSWVESQVGFAILVKSDVAGVPSSDITIRHNIIRGSANGINIAGIFDTLYRVAIVDNLITDIGSPQWDPSQSGGRLFQVINVADATIAHNTGMAPGMLLSFDGAPSPRLKFTDNVVSAGSYGIKGSGAGIGIPSLLAYTPNYSFAGNVIIGGDLSQYPPGNFASASVAATGFANVATGDYSLLTGSPFSGKALDGTNPGIDGSALGAATAGVKP